MVELYFTTKNVKIISYKNAFTRFVVFLRSRICTARWLFTPQKSGDFPSLCVCLVCSIALFCFGFKFAFPCWPNTLSLLRGSKLAADQTWSHTATWQPPSNNTRCAWKKLQKLMHACFCVCVLESCAQASFAKFPSARPRGIWRRKRARHGGGGGGGWLKFSVSANHETGLVGWESNVSASLSTPPAAGRVW